MKSFKFRNFNFIKIEPIIITLSRVKLVKYTQHNNNIKILLNLVNDENIMRMKNLEANLRKIINKLDGNKFLKSNFINSDNIWISNYLVKKINQSKFINCDPFTEKLFSDQFFDVDILINNIYYFDNNINTCFYKIKINTLDQIN